MPQAIPFIVKAIVAIGIKAPIAQAIATAFVYAAQTYALNKAAEALSKKGRDGNSGGGLEVSSIDSASAGRVIYGRVRVGGVHVIPPLVSGVGGQYLNQVQALAIHEVDSFESTYLDTDEITAGSITAISGSVNDGKVTGSSKYVDVAWLRRYAGTTTQNVDYHLNYWFPTQIPSTFRGRGVAYIASMFDWGKGKVYTGGVPVVTTVVKGKKCYDPRLDITPGASPTNPSYIAWTQNPALCWADYKMNSVYGQKVVAADIDWDSVVAAADDCYELVDEPTAATAPRYTFNGILSTAEDTVNNERLFIDAMLGKMAYTDGKYRIFAGRWRAPVYEIDKEDWVQIGAIQTTAPRGDDRFNGVVTYHVDPDRNWQRVEGPRRYNDTYKSEDAGERVWVEQEQPHCTNGYEAERKSEFTLRQSRNGIRLSGVLPPRFLRLRTWDNVTLYFDDLGWSGKTFTVSSCEINIDGSVNVVLSEEQEADWEDMEEADYGVQSTLPAPPTNYTTPGALASFSVTALLGTLQFDLTEPLIRPLSTRYQILRSPGTLAVAGSYSVLWEGDASRIVIPADVRSLYWYHGRAVTNSYFSDTSPNTFGIGTAPYIAPESAPGNRAYPDGELNFASTSYWTWVDSTAVAGGIPSSRAFFTGSGFNNTRGYVRIYVSSNNNGGASGQFIAPSRYDINSRSPQNAVPMLVGQRGIAYLAMRGTGSSGHPGAELRVVGMRTSSAGSVIDPTAQLVSVSGAPDLRSVSSGAWVTYVATFTMVTSFYDAAALIILPPIAHGGPTQFMDIGAAQMTIF